MSRDEMQRLLDDLPALACVFSHATFRRAAPPNRYSPKWKIESLNPRVIGNIDFVEDEAGGSVLVKCQHGFIRFHGRAQ